MKRLAGWSFVGLLATAMMMPLAYAQGGRGPGGPGGHDWEAMRQTMQAFRMVDTYWMNISFTLKVDNTKMAKLRPAFQEAWDARKKAQDKMRTTHDPKSMGDTIKAINQKLESKIKKILSSAEMSKLQAAAKESRPMGPGGRGGRGR